MSRTRGHVFIRAISAICVTALVLAACGGSDSSSNRNGRLNSTLCFDTQAEKDAAIEEAQKKLNEATTPTLEDASPSNNGGRATLAFIGQQSWWVRSASGGSTTTTTQPATTTSTSTSTSSTVASSTSSTVASSTDASTESTDVPTDSSIPLVGGVPLQQLRDDLEAVTNAPLCDSTDSSDTTVDPESSITCTATVRSDGASTDCARLLTVQFSYFLEGSNDSVSLWGNQDTVFGPIDDMRYIALTISIQGEYVFSQQVEPGIYAFEVPIVEESPETEFGDEGEGEFEGFSGTINPRNGENFVSFTIPEDYSADNFSMTLWAECEGQTVEAMLLKDAEEPVLFPDLDNEVLDDGLCGVQLIIDEITDEYFGESPFGETFDVIVTASTETRIMWGGSVPLMGEGVIVDGEEPYFSGVFDPITGEDTVSFTIPNNYSASYLHLELYAECENQSIEAAIIADDETFEIFTEMPYYVLNSGLCGVWLWIDDVSGNHRGKTFEVVIGTESSEQISWSGTVALEGDGVTRDDETLIEGDQGLVWEELFSEEIDADRYLTIEIPEGGRQIDVRAITTRFEGFVDPYLVIADESENVIARNDDGGEVYGYGDLSSRLNVFLEEGTYTVLATTYELWEVGVDEGSPRTYDLELRVGSLPAPTDQVAPSGELPEDQPIPVKVLDAPPSNLEQPGPMFALPVNEVINQDKSSNEPNPVIPAGVTEVVCDSGCLLALREAAGASEGVVTIQIGGEVIEVQPGARKAIIPVRPSAKEILVTVAPNDGGEPVVLSTEVLVISPRTFPVKMAEGAKSVTNSASSNGGIPTNLIVVLAVLALAIAIGLIRRQKVRLPE
jgi:hypothetical protein